MLTLETLIKTMKSQSGHGLPIPRDHLPDSWYKDRALERTMAGNQSRKTADQQPAEATDTGTVPMFNKTLRDWRIGKSIQTGGPAIIQRERQCQGDSVSMSTVALLEPRETALLIASGLLPFHCEWTADELPAVKRGEVREILRLEAQGETAVIRLSLPANALRGESITVNMPGYDSILATLAVDAGKRAQFVGKTGVRDDISSVAEPF